MSPRKTLVLAALLAVSALYLSKVVIPKRESSARTQRAFRNLETKDVSRIKVVPSSNLGAPYQLVQRPTASSGEDTGGEGVWEISELPDAPLESEVVKGLVTAATGLMITGPVSERDQSEDFSVYGLDKPTLTLTVTDSTGTETELAFGKENAYLENQRYTKVSGRSGIFMSDAASFTALAKSSKDTRSKTPLQVKSPDVRELTITSSAGTVKVTQPAVGEWKIAAPTEVAASSDRVNEFLSNLGAITVKEFLDGQQTSLGQYGLDKPDVDITIVLRPGVSPATRRIVLSRGEGKGAYFFYDGAPSVFSIDGEDTVISSVVKGVNDLREDKLFTLSTSDIESVRSITGDGQPSVEITTNKTDWDVNKKLSDPVFVDQLLHDIVDLRAVAFPDPTTVPVDAFSAPFLTMVITKKGTSKESMTLIVGKESSGKEGPLRFARLGDAGPVVMIRDVEAKRIVPHEEALLPRTTPSPVPSQT